MNKLVVQNMNEVKLTDRSERIYPIVFQLEELIFESIAALKNDNIEAVVSELSAFSQQLTQFQEGKGRNIRSYR